MTDDHILKRWEDAEFSKTHRVLRFARLVESEVLSECKANIEQISAHSQMLNERLAERDEQIASLEGEVDEAADAVLAAEADALLDEQAAAEEEAAEAEG